MKKGLIVFLLGIFLFPGCKKNTLVCEKKSKNAGYDYRDGATLVGNAPALYADAHNIITAVYLRSNPAALSSSGPSDNAPKLSASFGLEASETYLMNERRREFLFEAKRYYDLVRQARREGNTQKFSTAIASKFSGGEGSLKMNI